MASTSTRLLPDGGLNLVNHFSLFTELIEQFPLHNAVFRQFAPTLVQEGDIASFISFLLFVLYRGDYWHQCLHFSLRRTHVPLKKSQPNISVLTDRKQSLAGVLQKGCTLIAYHKCLTPIQRFRRGRTQLVERTELHVSKRDRVFSAFLFLGKTSTLCIAQNKLTFPCRAADVHDKCIQEFVQFVHDLSLVHDVTLSLTHEQICTARRDSLRRNHITSMSTLIGCTCANSSPTHQKLTCSSKQQQDTADKQTESLRERMFSLMLGVKMFPVSRTLQ